jgi:glutaredoxin-like protein
MPILNPEVRQQVSASLADLAAPVKLVVFTQGEGGALECDFCAEMRQLVEEVGALSDQLTVEVRDFEREPGLAAELGVDKIPALVVMRGGAQPKDYGIRFYGIPSGYEFSTLIEDIRLVSRGRPNLSPETLKSLTRLKEPVRIQVYVTPTCPYCPRAVLLAHKLALASDLITADMVEAQEFPHLAARYQVYGVPRTVIADVIHVEGAVPEAALVSKLMDVLDPAAMGQLTAEWEAQLN